MCSECSDWQNKNTAKCRPCQVKGAFRVRLFRAFITVHFFCAYGGRDICYGITGGVGSRMRMPNYFFVQGKGRFGYGSRHAATLLQPRSCHTAPFQHNRTISLHPSYFIGRNAML